MATTGPARRLSWRQLFTVEPVIFFYAYGLFMHQPIIQQYIYFRVSKEKGFPYNSTHSGGCYQDALNESAKLLEEEVQSLSSYVQLGIVMFSSIPSIFMALFIGAWTDDVGRRPALALPAVGSAIEALLAVLVIRLNWPIYVLFLAGFINGACGYFTTMVLAVMSYVADTTDESNRAFRLAIIELMVFMGGMVSQLTSGLWIEGLGYEAPYWFILSCFLASVVYVIFFVRESRPRTTETRACLFNLRSLRRVWHVYRNPRDGARKNLVILFICCGLIVLTTMGYSGVMLLYLVGSPLCFGPERIGYFFAARYTIVGLGAVLGIKLLGRCLTELTITRIGMVTLMASLVLFGFSKTAWVVFMVPVAGLFNGAVNPVFRGMISRMVSPDEQGAVFSAVASLETLCNFVGSFIFNSLYPAALKHNSPGLVFLLGALIVVIPFILVCFLKNPSSFMSKKDIIKTGNNTDPMADNLVDNMVGTSSTDSSSPLHSPGASVPGYQTAVDSETPSAPQV